MMSFEEDEIEPVGHKFGLPDLPLPPTGNLKYRYDPVVKTVTALLMKDGKLSVAQRVRERTTELKRRSTRVQEC
jgi:hypothetical protein